MGSIHYLAAIIAIAGIVAVVVGVLLAVNMEHVLIEGILFTVGGLCLSGSLLFAQSPGQQHLLADIRSWNVIGLNLMLALLVIFGTLAWYEIFKGKTRNEAGHYFWSQLFAFLTGLSLPLWSLHGIKAPGAGLVLFAAGAIIARKRGAEAKIVCCVLVGVGMGLMSIWVLGPLMGLAHAVVLGVAVLAGLAAIFGTLVIVQHRNSNGRYHPYRGPLYGGLLAVVIVVAIGLPFKIHAADVTSGAVAAVDKFDQPKHAAGQPKHAAGHGDTGNPLDLLAQAITATMHHHEKAMHHHEKAVSAGAR